MKSFLRLLLGLMLVFIAYKLFVYFYFPDARTITAIRNGDIETVTKLLNNGLDPNYKIPDTRLNRSYYHAKVGVPFIRYAATPEMAKLLIDHGADINAEDDLGWTCLTYNAQLHKLNTVQYLIDRGADIFHIGKDGYFSIRHIFIANENADVLELFIKKSGDLNKQDNWGNTLLIYVTENNRIENVKTLLKHGAKPAIANKEGKTALMIANKNGFKDIEQLIGLNIF